MKKNLVARIQGKQIPTGKVRVSGAKNAGTRLLAASLIADGPVRLQNYPTELVDARYKMDFISRSGGSVAVNEDLEYVDINATTLSDKLLESYDYPIRTTYLLVAGLIKRSGKARIPYPGGCKIGSRGYDLHIMVWEKLGATVKELPDYIEVTAPKGFAAGEIDFPISTIGGTENALICASTIKGETIIRNAYISPEIENLIGFLRAIGSTIEVIGNSLIRVNGNTTLNGTTYRVMPDRIEAITWIVYGVLSGGNITIEDVPFKSMEIPLIHLREAGIDYHQNSTSITVSPNSLSTGKIQPFELACGTHPGIISDMQPFYTLLGLHADGTSRIYDYRYPERLQYCAELAKFYEGGLEWSKGVITTFGNKTLKSTQANSTDLRGSMALVMAGLLADTQSEVKNVEMALRGYNNLEKKLKALNVNIEVFEEA